MFLSDQDIAKRVETKKIIIEPFDKKFIQPAAYDLRLHTNFRIFKNSNISHIDVKKPFDVTEFVQIKNDGNFVIHPREFILASTLESISLPNNIVGVLEGRSSLGRIGLIVHATAAFVGPGFSGHLTLEMSNISNLPIKLYPGMRIAQLGFITMTSEAKSVYGNKKLASKYQGQKAPTASMIWKDFESQK